MPEEMPESTPLTESSASVAGPEDQPVARGSNLWGWRDLAVFLPFAFISLLAANLLIVASYVAAKSLAGQHVDPKAVQNDPLFLLTLQLVFYALLFGFLYLLVVAHHRQPFWSSFKWRKPTGRQFYGYMLGGFFMALGVQFAPTLLPDKQDFPLEQMFTSPQVALALGAFATLVAPFMEELIFRGFLFSIFERQIGMLFAVIATAVLFAALHIPEYRGAWNHLLLIFLVGVVFSLARGLSGSLTPSVVLHFAYNFSLMTGLFFETQHFHKLGLMIAP
jgi:membrane protease YdiL (CAAX protease family)